MMMMMMIKEMIYFRERERVRKINVNEAKSQVETDNCWSDVFLEDYFSTAEAVHLSY